MDIDRFTWLKEPDVTTTCVEYVSYVYFPYDYHEFFEEDLN